jgi:hypothetical protein
MLHRDDLIFCKTESGLTSCGYNISNMLLKNTLNMPNSNSHYGHEFKKNKDDIRIAKLMEDLVVPSGLYYCHPMTKHKIFNYKSVDSSQEKGEKGEINIVNGMLDESVYDKLLGLVSIDKRKIFDRKTRKNKNIFQKVKDNSNSNSIESNIPLDMSLDVNIPNIVDEEEKGEKREKKTNKKKSLKINTQKLSQKSNHKKTKKVRFA